MAKAIEFGAAYYSDGYDMGDGIKVSIESDGIINIEARFECGHVGDNMTLSIHDLIITYAKLVEKARTR